MPTVEDYFDDDTDLPVPSSSRHVLPNTGERGALLQAIGDDDDDELDFNKLSEQGRGIFGENAAPPPPSANAKGKMTVRDGADDLRPSGPAAGGIPGMNPNTLMGGFMGDMIKLQQADEERLDKLRRQFGATTVKDPSVYKGWHSVYPLYFDAKVSKSAGRRVAASDAVWWPQATFIAQACRSLGLPCVLEPDRCHPADWENPGRVKVQYEVDGKLLNPIVKNRTLLYKHLSAQIRQAHPSLRYTKPEKRPLTDSSNTSRKPSPKSGKQRSTVRRRLPSRPAPPPQPIPSLEDRVPLHSPLVAAGVAVAAIKRDMENEKENKNKGGGGDEPAKEKQPKMKRVVVRGKR